MPELPEVEAIARTLGPLVRGQRIARCRVLHPIAVRPQPVATLRRGLEGQRVEGVERQGKYLLLRLGKGYALIHFRLDGQLVWFDSRRPTGHIDVALELTCGTLGFVDRRHFGRLQWVPRPEDMPGIRALGVDPLSSRFTPNCLETLLRKSRRPLKLFLLDQTRVAGLGNIYANEVLWHARLSPRRTACRVTVAEARRLHKAIVAVLRRALECCLDPAPDFHDPDGGSRDWRKSCARTIAPGNRVGAAVAASGVSCRAADPAIAASVANVEAFRARGIAGSAPGISMNPATNKKTEAPQKADFERSLARLEEVVRKLESADLSLDEAMKLFEEGVQLSRDCQKQLEEAEGRVEILLKKADGKLTTETFEPEAEDEAR